MLLQKKNGNIVAQFAVLLIIATIMIFVVTGFGAKIWSSFFPSGDKSALSSFETVNTMINAVLASPFDYESNSVGIYMAKNYEMVLFDEPTIKCKETKYISGGSGMGSTYDITVTYYAPDDCKSKQCLCLYDDDPEDTERKRNKNVVACKTFENKINISSNADYFELNDGVCGYDTKKYSSLIIAKRVEDDKKGYLYILKDTEENQKKDADWSVPMCADPGNVGGICSGHKADSFVPVDKDNFEKIYSYCSNVEGKSYKATGVQCILDSSKAKCIIDCAQGDVTTKCGSTYTQCSDFNKDSGITRFMDPQADYGNYMMCTSDSKYCNLKCTAGTWTSYICKTSQTGGVDSSCTLPSGCSEVYLANTGKLKDFLKSYDDSKEECKNATESRFFADKGTILKCKGELVGCKNFIISKKSECSIKYISNSDTGYIYWITYYDKACDTEVKNLFEPAQYCMDIPPAAT